MLKPILLIILSGLFIWPTDLTFAKSRKKGEKELIARMEQVPAEQLMTQISKKFKRNEKKYKALEKKIRQKLEKALSKHFWADPAETNDLYSMKNHPQAVLVKELTAQLLENAKRKNSPETKELLTIFPWDKDLELVIGLEYGSDREIPNHTEGFIHLGENPEHFPGFPDLVLNQYIYGFKEVLSWKYGVKQGKALSFSGRSKRDAASIETNPPPWEKLRMLLYGCQPDTGCYAIGQLTHLIHTRLAERRSETANGLSKMDEILAMIDSKWNGYSMETPYSKKPIAFVSPAHTVFTERNGFVYQFPYGNKLSLCGDVPFLSDCVYREYAKRYLNMNLSVSDFIRQTSDAEMASQEYDAASIYLCRYKSLVDLIVRAILTPNVRFPAYLKNFDYGKGRVMEREIDIDLDMPRKHALMLWAYVDKDPKKLADYLHDNLLSIEENLFPKDSSLVVKFTQHIRQEEQKIMEVIKDRVIGEKNGNFEKEFSPFENYGEKQGSFHSDYLAHSYQLFHGKLAKIIRHTTFECVIKELGHKWVAKL